ncbi:hypothetical protein B4U79_16230, partial [Dinothrombium tinctorium]
MSENQTKSTSCEQAAKLLGELCQRKRWPMPKYSFAEKYSSKSILHSGYCELANLHTYGDGIKKALVKQRAAQKMLDLLQKHNMYYSSLEKKFLSSICAPMETEKQASSTFDSQNSVKDLDNVCYQQSFNEMSTSVSNQNLSPTSKSSSDSGIDLIMSKQNSDDKLSNEQIYLEETSIDNIITLDKSNSQILNPIKNVAKEDMPKNSLNDFVKNEKSSDNLSPNVMNFNLKKSLSVQAQEFIPRNPCKIEQFSVASGIEQSLNECSTNAAYNQEFVSLEQSIQPALYQNQINSNDQREENIANKTFNVFTKVSETGSITERSNKNKLTAVNSSFIKVNMPSLFYVSQIFASASNHNTNINANKVERPILGRRKFYNSVETDGTSNQKTLFSQVDASPAEPLKNVNNFIPEDSNNAFSSAKQSIDLPLYQPEKEANFDFEILEADASYNNLESDEPSSNEQSDFLFKNQATGFTSQDSQISTNADCSISSQMKFQNVPPKNNSTSLNQALTSAT